MNGKNKYLNDILLHGKKKDFYGKKNVLNGKKIKLAQEMKEMITGKKLTSTEIKEISTRKISKVSK